MSSDESTSKEDEQPKTVQFTSSSTRVNKDVGRPRPKLVRQVGRMDLATGVRGARAQYIRLIDHSEDPRSRWDRCKFWGSRERKASRSGRVIVDGEEEKQYRIRSMVKDESRLFLSTNKISEDYVSRLNVFLRWTFRASFWEVGVLFLALFMILILFFAILTYSYGRLRPSCIWTNAGDYRADGNSFVDAYQLSWTTLSTVGYGIIGPRVSTIEPTMRCFGVNFFMAVESFIGVLFGSMTGAIIFGKIARFQSIAQVRFSDPICVRYGSGVLKQALDDEDDGDPDNVAEEKIELPCPILEFRLINDLSNVNGGEIVDASISVVACTLEDRDELESLRMTTRPGGPITPNKQFNILNKAAATTTKVATKAAITTTIAASRVAKSTTKGAAIAAKTTGVALFEAGKKATQATGSLVQRLNYHLSRDSYMFPLDGVEEAEPYNEKDLERALEKELEEVFAESIAAKLEEQRIKSVGVSMLEATRTSVTVDEGSKLVPRRIFHRLEIETDSHPFFKRVWNIRHVLNESSPLLSADARRMIRDNNGFWPEELNDHVKVREHVKFDEIVVNFSGTANASGSSVYAQKVYDYVDVNVGYTFANVLTTSYKGQLIVDPRLLNDVLEQIGGGAEPFTNVDKSKSAADIAAQIAVDAAGIAVTATQKAAEGVQAVAVVTGDTIKTHAINTGETIVAQAVNTTETLQAATKGVFRAHARGIIAAARAARKFGGSDAANDEDPARERSGDTDVESGVVADDVTGKNSKVD